ncbi:MAG: MerR family transcriptional regulator [Nitrospiraceae bacterium]
MNTHRIHRVAKLTGLSKDVIRMWERRHGLIQPTRSANRYRQYSDDDVLLLRHVKAEVDSGASIGTLALAGRDELLERAKRTAPPVARVVAAHPYTRLLDELCTSLDPLNKTMFERRLNGAVAIVPFEEALHGILIPLQQRVGDLWHEGRLSVAVEHYVSRLVQQKLYAVLNQLPVPEQGPQVIVACPAQETHELGALTVAYHCAARGCRVIYLGGDVPVGELARLCREIQPALALVSLTVIPNEKQLTELVSSLHKEVSSICPVGLGGPGIAPLLAAPPHTPPNLILLEDLSALNRVLDDVLAPHQAVHR